MPDIVITDSALKVGKSRCVMLMVEKHGGEVVQLSEGESLGEVTQVVQLRSWRQERMEGRKSW